jgi:hypothetical protein
MRASAGTEELSGMTIRWVTDADRQALRDHVELREVLDALWDGSRRRLNAFAHAAAALRDDPAAVAAVGRLIDEGWAGNGDELITVVRTMLRGDPGGM